MNAPAGGAAREEVLPRRHRASKARHARPVCSQRTQAAPRIITRMSPGKRDTVKTFNQDVYK